MGILEVKKGDETYVFFDNSCTKSRKDGRNFTSNMKKYEK